MKKNGTLKIIVGVITIIGILIASGIINLPGKANAEAIETETTERKEADKVLKSEIDKKIGDDVFKSEIEGLKAIQNIQHEAVLREIKALHK